MFEMITAFVLATAAGLNAYVPLLGLGLLARFTPLITLPESWNWLASDIMLIILAVLFVIELLVDKVPMLDTVNDVLQTVVRPASGGMVFAAGLGTETIAVENPETLADTSVWVPIVIGIIIALVPHVLKLVARPVLNTATAGAAAPVASTVEDAGAVSLTLLALIVPVLALIVLALFIWFVARQIKKARLKKLNRA